jgi:hypothetical protein
VLRATGSGNRHGGATASLATHLTGEEAQALLYVLNSGALSCVDRAMAAVRGISLRRLLAFFVLAIALGLLTDFLRTERVVFPAPLPPIEAVPQYR